MSKILSRNEFIEIKEQKEYEELQEINEGLIKNLFGRVKNKFGGWKKIDGNEEIKRVYAELDDKLTGFSSVKYEYGLPFVSVPVLSLYAAGMLCHMYIAVKA